jgi:Domain of unknown function (DUF3471)
MAWPAWSGRFPHAGVAVQARIVDQAIYGDAGAVVAAGWKTEYRVVVLSNVNGAAPDQKAHQLLNVVLGKPVELASEKKPVPISKEELAKFVGVYDLAPTFSITFAVDGDHLTGQGTGQPAFSLMYVGVKDGHPRFFVVEVGAEIEFVPDPAGGFASIVLHQGGHDTPGKRH